MRSTELDETQTRAQSMSRLNRLEDHMTEKVGLSSHGARRSVPRELAKEPS